MIATLVAGCIGSTGNPSVSAAAPGQPQRREDDRPNPTANAVGPTRAENCPAPPRADAPFDLADLPLFSKTLFYVRENHPQDLGPRARQLVVAALEAIAVQDTAVVVDRDRALPPRWVAVTVGGQQCTLNLERVDAPWSLRTKLHDAARFVQGHLAPAPPADQAKRLTAIEIAATNGMLTALDGRSRLLDPETYRQIRGFPPMQSGPITAGAGMGRTEGSKGAIAPAGAAMRAAQLPVAPGSTIAYLRIDSFLPGISAELERALVVLQAAPPKGIVLDLRGNTGGLLDEAVKVADAFIKSGTLGSTAGKRERKDFVAHDGGHEPGGPIVVLVDRQTAEGSELVAAAIKNLGRGIVLGEPTAGAATIALFFDLPGTRRPLPSKDRDVVQSILDGEKPPAPAAPKPDEDLLGLVLTSGRLLAAGGAEIEGAGVKPDLQLPVSALTPSRPGDDCLRQFADTLIRQARDPQRATLLSTAKTLAPAAVCHSAARQ